MNVPVPAWFVDDHLLKGGLSRAAIVATLALFAYGTVRPGAAGRPVVFARWTRREWATLAGCSLRSLQEALPVLVSGGLVTIHPAKRANQPDSFSIPLERARG